MYSCHLFLISSASVRFIPFCHDQPRQHIEKQLTFVNKGPSSQGYGFPVVTYGCENWTIKKAECWRIDVFELWCWRRLLRVPWTARRSNQSIVKEISPGCSLVGLMLKLKLQYFGHSQWRAQVGCLRQVLGPGALGRPRGMGWGGRWEGGSGWGTHVNPWLIYVNVWQKPLQYCKVISLQLIKINGKRKKEKTLMLGKV